MNNQVFVAMFSGINSEINSEDRDSFVKTIQMKKHSILSYAFKAFLILSISIISNSITAQIRLPNPNPTNNTPQLKLSEFETDYLELKSSSDTIDYKAQKEVDRWKYNVMNRMTVTNDSVYSLNNYSKAFSQMVQSGLFCNDTDKSSWENIGPFQMGHHNGIPNAIYVDPLNELNILIGAVSAGIFKTNDGGLNWECVTDNMDVPIVGVRQIVSNPFHPNDLIAITGASSGLDAIQSGYIISNDGGNSWSVGPDLGIDDELQWMCYRNETNHENDVYAVSKNYLWFSNNNGINWSPVNMPIDMIVNNSNSEEKRMLHKVLVAGETIFITNNGNDNNSGLWKGSIEFGNIQWEPNLLASMTGSSPEIIAPGIFNIPTFLSYSASGYSSSGDYNVLDHASNFGCNYNNYNPNNYSDFSGCWSAIQTFGWQKEDIDFSGIEKITCAESISENRFAEVLSIRLTKEKVVITDDGRTLKLKCRIPKGVKMQICYSNYSWSSGGYSSTDTWEICELQEYDYNSLFENVIYTYDYSNTDSSIDISDNFFLPNSLFEDIQNAKMYIYIKLEFDDNTYIQGEKFILDNFDITVNEDNGSFVNLSNLVKDPGGDRFFVHVEGKEHSVFYRTQNGGQSFEEVRRALPVSDNGNNKEELVASINNPDIYYYATLNSPIRSDINFPNGLTLYGDGEHPDYRSSFIGSFNGNDYLYFGNDGGITKTVNSDAITTCSECLESINGDLSINMIYNLDILEGTKQVLVGLQDNGTKLFLENQNSFEATSQADGCVTMLWNNPNELYQYVAGDPQYGGATALKDHPNNSLYNIVQTGNGIEKGEAYLGMRLEEYRFDNTKFVVGLQRLNSDTEASIILNEGVQITTKVDIPQSKRIGAIAICDRKPNTVYLADATYKANVGNTEKIFRTTTGGETSIEWTAIDPYVTLFPGTPEEATKLISNISAYDFVGAITCDPIEDNIVYIGMAGIEEFDGELLDGVFRVMKSTDYGDSFIDWSDGLSPLPVNYLLTVESDNHLIFCGTDAGVYYRHDGMDRWDCFNNNLPKTRITDLVYDYCAKELLASTFGRGVWSTPVNISTAGGYQQEITTNTTWTTDQTIQNDLVIKEGTVLTISNCEVSVDADRKIIIEPGARLIMYNSSLTNKCGSYWSGIQVYGNSNDPQYATNQGSLTMTNSTIEYAYDAVRVWKVDDWNSTGGIVRATNSNFINNKRDVEFIQYDWEIEGVGQPNKSYFNNCVFKTTDDLPSEDVNDHVTMYKVHDVRFLGCDFEDERDVEAFNKGRGIFSIDAKYKVLGKYTGTTTQTIPYYDEMLYDVCTFKNLYSGIEVLNANSRNTVAIDHAKFTDCFQGVKLSAVDDAMITRNYFERTENADWFQYQYDIYTDKSHAYLIEGNEMVATESEYPSIGAWIGNSGYEDELVYKNKMTDLTVGSFSYLKNRNDLPLTSPGLEGLEIKCNENKGSQHSDEYVSGLGLYQGIRVRQGSQSESVGNSFSSISGSIGSLKSNLTTEIEYYFKENGAGSSEEPLNNDNNFAVIQADEITGCLTNLDLVIPGPGKPIGNVELVNLMKINFEQFDDEYGTKIDLYNQTTDSTDLAKIQGELLELNQSKNQIANSMIKNMVLDSLGINTEDYESWIVKRNDLFKDLQLADFYISKGQKQVCQDYIDEIDDKISALPIGDLRTELEQLSAFKSDILLLTNAKGILEGLDSTDAAIIRNYATNSVGYARVQAQNLMCFFLDECPEVIVPQLSNHSMINFPVAQNVELIEELESILVYPNPTDNEVTIVYDTEWEKVRVVLYDVHGREVLNKDSGSYKTTLEVSKLTEGVYTVVVFSEGLIKGRSKLIIQ